MGYMHVGYINAYFNRDSRGNERGITPNLEIDGWDNTRNRALGRHLRYHLYARIMKIFEIVDQPRSALRSNQAGLKGSIRM